MAHRGHTASGRVGWLRYLHDHELILQETGTAWIWWEDSAGSVDLPPGHLAVVPPGAVHSYAGHRQGVHLAIHFDLRARPELVPPQMLAPLGRSVRPRPIDGMPEVELAGRRLALIRRLSDPERWIARWDRLIEARLRPEDPGGRLRAQSLLGSMLADLLSEDESPRQGDARILQLLRSFDEPPPPNAVAGLCHRCGMGETAFRAAFKLATGELPQRYFERRRIERAVSLLIDTDLPVAAIGERVGYDDPFHFSRVVKRVTGHPPSWFRG